jgi:hypothetical protein
MRSVHNTPPTDSRRYTEMRLDLQAEQRDGDRRDSHRKYHAEMLDAGYKRTACGSYTRPGVTIVGRPGPPIDLRDSHRKRRPDEFYNMLSRTPPSPRRGEQVRLDEVGAAIRRLRHVVDSTPCASRSRRADLKRTARILEWLEDATIDKLEATGLGLGLPDLSSRRPNR